MCMYIYACQNLKNKMGIKRLGRSPVVTQWQPAVGDVNSPGDQGPRRDSCPVNGTPSTTLFLFEYGQLIGKWGEMEAIASVRMWN